VGGREKGGVSRMVVVRVCAGNDTRLCFVMHSHESVCNRIRTMHLQDPVVQRLAVLLVITVMNMLGVRIPCMHLFLNV
jgi:hypothetical protein